MLFNSLHFLIFFPVVTGLYFLLPHRIRWALLLAASCYFYMVFRPIYILILVFTIVVDYTSGIAIENAHGGRRKAFLIASLMANIGCLSFFKYYNFLDDAITHILGLGGLRNPIPFLQILLPIGLSFHVFQSLSYTIEVYRGRYAAERHFGIFALYVMFYPQLVAGPIERPQNLLHQFRERHNFDYQRVVFGLQLMVFGMFKKVMIADRLASFANRVYDAPHSYTGVSFVVATLCFTFQIYCDFSGYSDIALGSAQVMGFTLMKNFDRPYFSKSVAEFWKRWHISLSSWFRDYLYIPLGGSRVSRPRWYFNLLFTFLISGLWHGANWTYVFWGGLNGLYLIMETLLTRPAMSLFPSGFLGRWRLPVRAVRAGVTFTLICISWIFFRARNLADAFYILSRLFDGFGTLPADIGSAAFVKTNILMMQDKMDACIACVCVMILLSIHWIQRRHSVRALLAAQRPWVRWGVYYAAVAGLLFFGAFNSSQQFIYFQF